MAFVPVSTKNIAEKIDFILLYQEVPRDGTGNAVFFTQIGILFSNFKDFKKYLQYLEVVQFLLS